MRLILTTLLTVITILFADPLPGMVCGTVSSTGNGSPVPGAMVLLEGTELGAITDSDGSFAITGIQPGAYVLSVNSVGFHPRSLPDVIVRPGRETRVDAELEYSVLDAGVIHVTPDYFPETPGGASGATALSGEQVRRSPGSAGDVSRVITALPSVTGIDDQYNGLAVRGGNPSENGFYLDGMPVPNINHFPRQGTAGGGLGMINTDLISEVEFFPGGFASVYGDRISSVMEITTRQGSRMGFEGQADLSMSGAGAVLEGPLGRDGSWVLCARRSYVDLLVGIAEIDAVPVYSDCHLKMVYDPNPSDRLSLSFLGADDYVDYTRDDAWEDGNENYGITDTWNAAAGLSWRHLWPEDGSSVTVLSWNGTGYGGEYMHTLTGDIQALQDSREQAVTISSRNTWQPAGGFRLEFGGETRWRSWDLNNFYAADSNWSGEALPELFVTGNHSTFQGGLFADASIPLGGSLTFDAGGRMDAAGFSPRASLELRTSPVTTVTAAGGVYRQSLPGELTARDTVFDELDTPSSTHWILGFSHLPEPDVKLQADCYLKLGNGYPYDPEQPGYFILDGVSGEQDLYSFRQLESGGETRSAGLELTLRKQLVSGLYGLAAGSVSMSGYRNPGEPWRRRIYDTGWNGSLEGGYRFDNGWELSCRWLFAGGRPYTPLDISASEQLNRTVLDSTRINALRYPYYSSLNMRADRRFNFSESSLVVYLSVWNLLNRRNVTATYWNRIENREDSLYQWALMPVFGVEYEF